MSQLEVSILARFPQVSCFLVTKAPFVGLGGEGGCTVSVGTGLCSVALAGSSSLVFADQNRLLDPLVGRVLKIMADGREEIGPYNGLFEFG